MNNIEQNSNAEIVESNNETVIEDIDQEQNMQYQQQSPLLDFLASTNGAQIANQMIDAFKGLQVEGNKAQVAISKFDKLMTCVLVIIVVIAVTCLTYFDKFTPSIGVLFGSLVGYIYGKKS